MKVKKTTKQKAKHLLAASLNDKNEIDQQKVDRIVKWLVTSTMSDRLPLLRVYKTLLSTEINKRTAFITSAVALEEAEIADITKQLAKKTGFSVQAVVELDRKLVSGIRVRLYDTIFDNSLKGKLEQLKTSL